MAVYAHCMVQGTFALMFVGHFIATPLSVFTIFDPVYLKGSILITFVWQSILHEVRVPYGYKSDMATYLDNNPNPDIQVDLYRK